MLFFLVGRRGYRGIKMALGLAPQSLEKIFFYFHLLIVWLFIIIILPFFLSFFI
jgi:hypothetical protein